MKYFYDTEFIERGSEHPIQLISIGMVAEDGRELYFQNSFCNFWTATDWVWENVIKQLKDAEVDVKTKHISLSENESCWRIPKDIAIELQRFVGDDENAEFWGYYSDYDHVILSQLFGTMMDLPKNFPMFTMDIKQRCVSLGNPKLPKQKSGEHNALDDARWNRDMDEFLNQYEVPRLIAPESPEVVEQLAEALKKTRNTSVMVMPKETGIFKRKEESDEEE